MKLNLGSGKDYRKGWKNIDIDPKWKPDVCYDIGSGIQEDKNSVDEILISHTLMYFRHSAVLDLLKECYRVLKRDGVIRITEDNRHVKIRNAKQQKQYGDGELADRLQMTEFLREAGFRRIESYDPEFVRPTPPNYSLASGRAAVYFISARKLPRGPICYLALDDFGETNNNLDLLWRLWNHFDDFKVNLFAIPDDCLRESWMDYIADLGWIRLFVHGYNHLSREELDEVTLKILVRKYFHKGYKAPLWQMSHDMYDQLTELGFKIFLFPNDKREGIKFNWDIRNSYPKVDVLHGFGHIYPHDYVGRKGVRGNSLYYFMGNVLALPHDTRFKFYE